MVKNIADIPVIDCEEKHGGSDKTTSQSGPFCYISIFTSNVSTVLLHRGRPLTTLRFLGHFQTTPRGSVTVRNIWSTPLP